MDLRFYDDNNIFCSFLPPYFGFEPIDKSSVDDCYFRQGIKLIFYYLHERVWFLSNWGVLKLKD